MLFPFDIVIGFPDLVDLPEFSQKPHIDFEKIMQNNETYYKVIDFGGFDHITKNVSEKIYESSRPCIYQSKIVYPWCEQPDDVALNLTTFKNFLYIIKKGDIYTKDQYNTINESIQQALLIFENETTCKYVRKFRKYYDNYKDTNIDLSTWSLPKGKY